MKRFWDKVKKTETCWIWTASKDRGGYGRIYFNGKLVGVHRYSWKIHKGPLKNGKKWQIDHLCKNRACVNPDHLDYVPRKVNILRSNTPSAINARKTHCIYGHPFNKQNTRIDKAPFGLMRTCLLCKREYCRKYQYKVRKEFREKNPIKPRIFPKKTHCIHGHLFDLKNTYIHDGKQCCRRCRANTQRKRRDIVRGAPPRKCVRKYPQAGAPVSPVTGPPPGGAVKAPGR